MHNHSSGSTCASSHLIETFRGGYGEPSVRSAPRRVFEPIASRASVRPLPPARTRALANRSLPAAVLTRNSGERGSALVLALFVMIIMTLLGLTFVLTGQTES